jgi:hypothetical protein
MAHFLMIAAVLAALGFQTPETEAFRLRWTNSEFGAIEASLDRGRTWLLLGRVLRPASETSIGGSMPVGKVERSSRHGIAFSAGNGRLVRLLPDSTGNRRDLSAALANVPPTAGLFNHAMPPTGAVVRQTAARRTVDLPDGYIPQDGDVLEVQIPVGSDTRERLSNWVRDAAERYRELSEARLAATGQKPVSGILTVNAKLSEMDTPAGVTLLIDGEVVAIVNHAPYAVKWDSRRMPDGEHVIEVRALDASGSTLSKKRRLIFVQNSAKG